MPNLKSELKYFNAHDSFRTTVKVLELAKELGLEVVDHDETNWVAFLKDGIPVEHLVFFHPSHAYAFLLGYKSNV